MCSHECWVQGDDLFPLSMGWQTLNTPLRCCCLSTSSALFATMTGAFLQIYAPDRQSKPCLYCCRGSSLPSSRIWHLPCWVLSGSCCPVPPACLDHSEWQPAFCCVKSGPTNLESSANLMSTACSRSLIMVLNRTHVLVYPSRLSCPNMIMWILCETVLLQSKWQPLLSPSLRVLCEFTRLSGFFFQSNSLEWSFTEIFTLIMKSYSETKSELLNC